MSKFIAKRALVPHPAATASDLVLGCKLSLLGSDVLQIEFAVSGNLDAIVLPNRDPATADWADNLWQTTCFEMFFGMTDGKYVEFNLSPSKAWAAYRFEGYRAGMQAALDLARPSIFPERSTDRRFGLTALVELGPLHLTGSCPLALAAVIEETDGTKSYWALKHPPGPPDFHHPDCFQLTLPAPD